MINYLIDRLKATTEVTAVVGTSKIYPLSRLDGTAIPAIVLQMTDCEPVESKDRTLNLDLTTVEVTTLADNPKAAWDLSVYCRRSLNNFTSTEILSCAFTGWASDVFEARDVFTITSTYAVRVKIDNV
jgi:hypothetical protein